LLAVLSGHLVRHNVQCRHAFGCACLRRLVGSLLHSGELKQKVNLYTKAWKSKWSFISKRTIIGSVTTLIKHPGRTQTIHHGDKQFLTMDLAKEYALQEAREAIDRVSRTLKMEVDAAS
jgi:hypothetical protein